MNRTIRSIGALLSLLCNLAMGLAFGVATGETIKTEGLIVSRQQEPITMRTADRSEIVVVVTEYTKVVVPKNLFRNKKMPSSSLVPGLWIKVQGWGSTGPRDRASSQFLTQRSQDGQCHSGGPAPPRHEVEAHQQQIQARLLNIQGNQPSMLGSGSAAATHPLLAKYGLTRLLEFRRCAMGKAKLIVLPRGQRELKRFAPTEASVEPGKRCTTVFGR
jgi:hypothetical protein